MRSFKRIILPAVLLAVVMFILNTGLNRALIPYSYVRIMMHNLKTQKYDTVVIGTSHGLSGINPKLLTELTGENSINLAMGGEFPLDAYYLLKLAGSRHMPERVVYELDPGYWCTPEGQEGDFNRIYYEMPWSVAKLQYFGAKTMKADFRATLFPWFYYRSQIKNAAKILETKSSEVYQNYGTEPFRQQNQAFEDGFMKIQEMPGPKTPLNLILWNEATFQKESERYFRKMVTYCRDNGIELTVITTPVPAQARQEHPEYARADAFFAEYMSRIGVPYLNYNLPGHEIAGFDYSMNAFSDYEGHLTKSQAKLMTQKLAEDLLAAGAQERE